MGRLHIHGRKASKVPLTVRCEKDFMPIHGTVRMWFVWLGAMGCVLVWHTQSLSVWFALAFAFLSSAAVAPCRTMPTPVRTVRRCLNRRKFIPLKSCEQRTCQKECNLFFSVQTKIRRGNRWDQCSTVNVFVHNCVAMCNLSIPIRWNRQASSMYFQHNNVLLVCTVCR